MSETTNTILTIVLMPIVALLVNWLTKRQERQNARDVAEIESRAENTEAAAMLFKTTSDMMAPLRQQIETVSKDNLSLQVLVEELKRENRKRQQEEMRLKQLDQQRLKQLEAVETENDRLKTRVQSLEKISLQQSDEIRSLRDENGRLQAKLERVTVALDTGSFKTKGE